MTCRRVLTILLFAGAIGVQPAIGATWQDRLARTFSGRYAEIGRELSEIEGWLRHHLR